MDKNEFIAEAKRRGFSDSEIQELVDSHENLVQLVFCNIHLMYPIFT
jgi:hypothetical protein